MSQVAQLAKGAGIPARQIATAVAIAAAESNLNPAARGDVGIQTAKWGPSIGLWQIRSLKAQTGTGGVRDAARLTDPAFNARAMATISGRGSDWSPWSTYNSGAYKKHLAYAQVAAQLVAPSAGPVTASVPTSAATGGGGGSSTPRGWENGQLGRGSDGKAYDLPGPDGLYGLGGLAGLGALLGSYWGDDASRAAGGAVDAATAQLREAALVALIWTAALGLGVSLVAIGAWRSTKGSGS